MRNSHSKVNATYIVLKRRLIKSTPNFPLSRCTQCYFSPQLSSAVAHLTQTLLLPLWEIGKHTSDEGNKQIVWDFIDQRVACLLFALTARRAFIVTRWNELKAAWFIKLKIAAQKNVVMSRLWIQMLIREKSKLSATSTKSNHLGFGILDKKFWF